MDTANLMIIGTSHISSESVNEIKASMQKFDPDIVAVELDVNRYYALLNKTKSKIGVSAILKIGVTGFLFALLGKFVQQKLGKVVNVEPGSDMMIAVKLAKKSKRKVALIDQDIHVTLKRFSRFLSWKERFTFVGDIIRGLLFPKSEMRKFGIDELDFTKVPTKKVIKKLTGVLKKRYPNVYKILLEERNIVMAKRLKQIMIQEPNKKILAVVGAAHHDGMVKLLEKENDISYTFSVGG